MYKAKIQLSWYIHELIKRIHAHPTWKHKERSGYMRMIPVEEWYKAIDITFPEQVNSAAHTEITEAGKDKFLVDVLTNTPEQAWEWFCWIHSHNTMQAFWSGEDKNTRDDFALQSDWFLSIVTATGWGNHKHDNVYYNGTFDVFKPLRVEVDCEISVESLPDFSSEKEIMKQLIIDKYSTPLDTNSISAIQQMVNWPITMIEEIVLDNTKRMNDELAKIDSMISNWVDKFFIGTEEKSISEYIKSLTAAEKAKYSGRKHYWDGSYGYWMFEDYSKENQRVQPYHHQTIQKFGKLNRSNMPVVWSIIEHEENPKWCGSVTGVDYKKQKVYFTSREDKEDYYFDFANLYSYSYVH